MFDDVFYLYYFEPLQCFKWSCVDFFISSYFHEETVEMFLNLFTVVRVSAFSCRPLSSRHVTSTNTNTLQPVCVFVLKAAGGWGGWMGLWWANKGLRRRCGGSVKLRFLIRGGIPEPDQSRHQTVLPLWRPSGGMRFSRRYRGTPGLLGGKVHRARRWGDGWGWGGGGMKTLKVRLTTPDCTA